MISRINVLFAGLAIAALAPRAHPQRRRAAGDDCAAGSSLGSKVKGP